MIVEQNYTESPWKKGKTSPDQIMLLGSSGNYVCHIQIQQTGGGAIAAFMEKERLANAQLIEAAPDMFEALVMARHVIGQLTQDSLFDNAKTKINEVIAKATQDQS